MGGAGRQLTSELMFSLHSQGYPVTRGERPAHAKCLCPLVAWNLPKKLLQKSKANPEPLHRRALLQLIPPFSRGLDCSWASCGQGFVLGTDTVTEIIFQVNYIEYMCCFQFLNFILKWNMLNIQLNILVIYDVIQPSSLLLKLHPQVFPSPTP